MTLKNPPPGLVMVGAVSKDEMIYQEDCTVLWGGAVIYGSVAAIRSGARIRVITKAAPKDIPTLNWFREDRIPVTFLESERSTSIRNIYHTEDRERRTCIPLSQTDPFSPKDLEGVQGQIFYAAGLIKGEIPKATLSAMGNKGRLAIDVQGFIREARNGELVLEADPTLDLGRVDFLKADGAEAQEMTGLTDAARAAKAFRDQGVKEVVITHGKSVTLAFEDRILRCPLTPKNLGGRTGRGDTLFSSYLARRLAKDSPAAALEFAAALTSIKMETPGPFGGRMKDVERRRAADRVSCRTICAPLPVQSKESVTP